MEKLNKYSCINVNVHSPTIKICVNFHVNEVESWQNLASSYLFEILFIYYSHIHIHVFQEFILQIGPKGLIRGFAVVIYVHLAVSCQKICKCVGKNGKNGKE